MTLIGIGIGIGYSAGAGAGAAPADPTTVIVASPTWGSGQAVLGGPTVFTFTPDGDWATLELYDGVPGVDGTLITTLTSPTNTWTPDATFSSNAVYAKEPTSAVVSNKFIVAGLFTDALTHAANNANAVTLTPTTLTAKRGASIIAAHSGVSGVAMTAPTIGGVTASNLTGNLSPAASRQSRWFFRTIATANPEVVFTDPGTSNRCGMIQVVGFVMTSVENPMPAYDAGTDNDTLTLTFASEQGLTLSLASSASEILTGHTEIASLDNVGGWGAKYSASATGLAVTAARLSGTQAERWFCGVRLAAETS